MLWKYKFFFLQCYEPRHVFSQVQVQPDLDCLLMEGQYTGSPSWATASVEQGAAWLCFLISRHPQSLLGQHTTLLPKVYFPWNSTQNTDWLISLLAPLTPSQQRPKIWLCIIFVSIFWKKSSCFLKTHRMRSLDSLMQLFSTPSS